MKKSTPGSLHFMIRLQTVKLFLLSAFFLSIAPFLSAQDTPIFEWAGALGGTLAETPTGIATDASGNVYTTGYFNGTTDFDPGAAVYNLTPVGGDDIFVAKVDANGEFVWAISMGGIGDDNGNAIAVDNAGNIYTTGFFNGTADFDPGIGTFNITALGSAEVFVSKVDPDGNLVWAKSAGGTSFEQAYAIALDASGNIYTTGYFFGTADFDPAAGTFDLTSLAQSDVFIWKLANNGDFVWAKAFPGTDAERGKSIDVDAAGNVYTTGFFFESTIDLDPGPGVVNLTSSFRDTFISKLDANGNFIWARAIGGTTSGIESESLALDNSNNILITGSFFGVADADPGAGVLNLTADSGSSIPDIFIVKLDTDGNLVWARSMGLNSNAQLGKSINTDASGNVYTTGVFSGVTDFDPGPGVYNLTPVGGSDIFISRLDTDGNFEWAISMGGTGGEGGEAITTDALGNVYTAGVFSTATDFDFGVCTFNLSPVGIIDAFVHKVRIGAVAAPTITSFSPVAGPVGTVVTITGTNFSTVPGNNAVSFFNNKTAAVTASTTTSITTTVPAGAITGKISVTVNCVTVQSAADFTVGAASLPTITSFTPASGPIGTTVTITGTNFSTTPASNTVQFNGTTAVASASTATSITTTVPAGATTGKITVTVGGNTATSATNFTVTIPGTITFTTQPVDRITCAGTTTTFSLTATGDTNLQYQWQIDNTGFVNLANNATYSGVSSATLTITNPTVSLSGKVYRCLVRGDNTTNTASASVTLTVNSTPAAPTISATDLGCAPAGTTLSPAGALAGQSYRYYDAATAGNLVSSGASFNTPLLSASTTYFISTYHTTTLCESARTPALVTVQTCNPPIVIATTSGAYLEGIVTIDLNPLISDPDNNVDVSTLQIISQPVSGATATLDALMLTVDYSGLPFPGTDVLRIGICDLTEICTEQELTIETAGDITVYNALSPNNDGKNDTFILRYIDLFTDTQNNKVVIFNRWGDVIFETENYDNKERVFKGLNKSGNEVPSGTYFYKIEYTSGRKAGMGYLVLKR
jgi:gliding motility-associated-like protein